MSELSFKTGLPFFLGTEGTGNYPCKFTGDLDNFAFWTRALTCKEVKELYEAGALSKSDYEAMQLSYNVSNTQYNNLVENTILRSPVSGVITARNYDVGDMYAMASPIYVVQQITPVKDLATAADIMTHF